MSGEIGDLGGAIGDAVTGGAIGSSIEPKSNGGTSEESARGEGECLNCGTKVVGAHCHECGQKISVHRSLSEIGHDLIHGVLHLDGKFWRTLPLLFFKPGVLTRRYVAGERAKFVSPMALFLFSVFMMFAVFQAVGLTTPTTLDVEPKLEASLSEALAEAREERDEARIALEELAADDAKRTEAQFDLDRAEEALAGLQTASGYAGDEDDLDVSFKGTGIGWIDDGLIEKWKTNPGLMLYKLQNNSYKFSWLLIPLSIPFVWLLFFWKRRFKAYDHAIFVTYSLAFMSLLFIILSLAGKFGLSYGVIALVAVLIPPIHIYKQLKYGYDLSRMGAFWRTAALTNMIVFIVLMIFLWLLLLLGAF